MSNCVERAIVQMVLFIALLSAASANESLLSSLKQESLRLDREKNREDAAKLRLEWVSPVNALYSESSNNDFDPKKDTKGLTLSISQPFFRSGGIIYAIKYANEFEKFNDISIEIKEKELVKSVVSLIQNIRKIELQLKKQEFLIANAKIEIKRKKEQFDSGLLDSSTLDRAILDKNQYEMQALELQSQKSELLKSLKDISDSDYESAKIPVFEAITQEEYMQNNVELKKAALYSEQQRFRKNAFITSFLPTFALNVRYNKQYGEMGYSKEYWNDYSTFGVSVSMPILDINMPSKIESYRIDYLKAALEVKERERSEQNGFENIDRQINVIDKKIALAARDRELYDSLLKDAKEKYEAGEKTLLDVETLKNSKEIKMLDWQIYGIEKQLKLLELYAKVGNGAL